MSTTANGRVPGTREEGTKRPHPWLHEGSGKATDDPADCGKDPPATVLPLGGIDTGYKGFALGVLVEALTSGLAGSGRLDNPDAWGASVFIQLIDPEAFGGKAAFQRVTQHLADSCVRVKPIAEPVRMPGSRALRLRDQQKKNGLQLHPSIPPALKACGDEYGIAFPGRKS